MTVTTLPSPVSAPALLRLSVPLDDELGVLARLETQLRRHTAGFVRADGSMHLGFTALGAYYDGMQRLEQLGLAVPPELRRFITIVNWPQVVVDAVEERVDLEGFRLPGQPDADEELWRIWQANDLDEESQLGHVDALRFGRAFVCAGHNPDDDATPLVTVESPLEVAAERDPRSRAVRHAARLYMDVDADGAEVRKATLYLPDETVWLVQGRDGWVLDEDDTPGRDEHGLGVPPVVQLTHRERLNNRFGSSHMLNAISLTDAAARALTNAQVAAELMAIPQRWAVGMSKGDFVDEDGTPLTVWESYFGAIASTTNPDAKFGQFSAADLSNFKTIVDHYGQQLAGLYGLPVRYMGQNTANPPSADAIRADEARLIKTAERVERGWGGSWERVMRLVRRLIDGDWNPDLAQMETLWRNPATPTQAQAADAAVKLHAEGILPTEAVWEDLGYSAVRRMKLRKQFEAERTDPVAALLGNLPANSQTPAQAPTQPPQAPRGAPVAAPAVSGAPAGG